MEINIPILYYHFVRKPKADTRIKGLYTSSKQFEWQLKRLQKNGFTCITFEDVVKKKYDTTKRNIILTFDDGCESLYDNAFPILKKYGAKAVVYVVAESVGCKNVVWEQNENNDAISTLTKNQMLEMINYGIEFGSHACNHVHLNQLSAEALHRELKTSKQILEAELGREIYSVAYPFGSYNAEVLKVASEVGYEFGVTTKPGDNRLANEFELFRIGVKGYSLRHYWYFLKTMNKLLKLND